MSRPLSHGDREALHELAPVLRRAVGLDPRSLARLRLGRNAAAALVRLPFGVLVARTVEAAAREGTADLTVRAGELLAWLDGETDELPATRDVEWRSGLPPVDGWARVEAVPDDVVRPLVRSGALTLKEAAQREGVPGAQPRAEVADALLDSTVLTVEDDDGTRAEVTLRALSALTRMGFLPRGGRAHIDVHGRWTRVVAEYGTVYLERPGGLTLR
ncbi:hypothetical protein [uncultured Jatrophihabitans sp.]|uniref:hypothetical protein n=1 Tax=uncultured Jatrophihabitans sp. TaxID=1610747 RepID=UPI0035CA3E95